MIVIRWIIGFFKTLVNLWDWTEWRYYVDHGLPPKTPAFHRWEVRVEASEKEPETEAERVLPTKNQRVILHDKYHLRADEMLFYTTDTDKVDALVAEYERELRTRTSGNFYYKMVRGRNLDFFHEFRQLGEEPLKEGLEIDEETEREKFLR